MLFADFSGCGLLDPFEAFGDVVLGGVFSCSTCFFISADLSIFDSFLLGTIGYKLMLSTLYLATLYYD